MSGRSELILSSGVAVRLADFTGQIEHIELPIGASRFCDTGLSREHEALVTSILVRPPDEDIVTEDLGVLEFTYNGRRHFAAPVAALMNRYHGLTRLAQVVSGMRLLLDPSLGSDDWVGGGTFANALPEPIWVREGMMYSLRHHRAPGKQLGEQQPITVEIQALVKGHELDILPFFKFGVP